MAVMPALHIETLDVFIGAQPILSGIDLSIAAGERVALLGESGSGKSMTARATLGLLPPQARLSGRITVSGCDVTQAVALARPANARPAMVTQDTLAALNPLASIGYQLERPLLRRGRNRSEARAEALAILADVGLPEPRQIAARCSPELSGGQRQRVCIAIALACAAKVIIADEPTSALDVITQAQVLKLLDRVTSVPGGPGLLFITHDLHAAAHLCDRALVIETGHIVEAGSMQQVLTEPRHTYTRRLIASAASCGIACERLYA